MPTIYRCEGCGQETAATNLYGGKCPEPKVPWLPIHVWAHAEVDPPPDHVPAEWADA